MTKWRRGTRKTIGEEWTPEGRVTDEELLNRVILAKALQVYAASRTMHLKTREGDFEITPRVARDVMKAAGQLPMAGRKKKPTKHRR